MTMHKRSLINNYRYIAVIIAAITLLIIGIFMLYQVVTYPEQYSTISRKALVDKLNSGDENAIEYYDSRYIDRDVYLFNGPMTVQLYANKYELNYDDVLDDYKASNCESFQVYFDICK